MASGKKTNGAVTNQFEPSRETPHVLKLSKQRFRRSSLDAFAEDFSNLQEVAADDVLTGRLPEMRHNSAQKAYSGILHMIDIQMRARKMGISGRSAKLLKP